MSQMHDGYGGHQYYHWKQAKALLEIAEHAMEIIEDILPYVPDYFQEKWNYPEELAYLKQALKEAKSDEPV